MMFPGYFDYGWMAWMMIASVVSWVAVIVLAVVLIIRISARLDAEDRASRH
jgi:hypothetical protein